MSLDQLAFAFAIMRAVEYEEDIQHNSLSLIQLYNILTQDFPMQIRDELVTTITQYECNTLDNCIACYKAAQPLCQKEVEKLIVRKYLSLINKDIDFRKSTNAFAKYNVATSSRTTPWFNFPSSFITICNLRFLCYKEQIVLQNGGLIDKDVAIIAIEKFLESGIHISKLQLCSANNYIVKLQNVDGIPQHTTSTPICLDMDYLTGLLIKEELPMFKTLLKEAGVTDTIDALPHMFAQDLFKNAAQRIQTLRPHIDKQVRNITMKARPNSKPKLFISLGGIGSGKSKLEDFVRRNTNNNYISCSVDNMRSTSDIYQLIIASNHHNDDYICMKEYAYSIFEMVTQVARNKRLNFFRDSSAIPYVGKNQHIVEDFQYHGFITYCLISAAMLIGNYPTDELVHNRIVKRFFNRHRAVPWPISIYKHIKQPISQMEAITDPSINYAIIFDNMSSQDVTVIAAYSKDLEYEEARHIKVDELTIDDLQKHKLLPLPFDNNTEYSNEKLALIKYQLPSGKIRIVVILDKFLMQDVMLKSLYNPDAKGWQELTNNVYRWHE